MRTQLGWAAWEAEVNAELELSSTVASGSQAHDPGDGVDRRHHSETDYALQVDAKHTVQKSYPLNRRFLRQSQERARAAGQAFALPVRFADRTEGLGEAEDYAVIPFGDYVALVKAFREAEKSG